MSLNGLKDLDKYITELTKFKSLSVVVGLPKTSKGAASKYPDGTEVLDVAYVHEMGDGKNFRRSFLRDTFIIKQKEMANIINKQAKNIGKVSADNVMSRIGLGARNLVIEAFKTEGYGNWTQSERAKAEGGLTLRDTGRLSQSISYEVR